MLQGGPPIKAVARRTGADGREPTWGIGAGGDRSSSNASFGLRKADKSRSQASLAHVLSARRSTGGCYGRLPSWPMPPTASAFAVETLPHYWFPGGLLHLQVIE
jgi:hypothetical protein